MDTPGQPPSMRSRILNGLAWKAFSQAFRQLARIAVAIVLARLLTPHDFGLAAMVLVFSSLVIIFSDLSLGAALVQRQQLTEQDRSTVFWVSTGVGLLFTVAGIAVSGPVAAFYGEPEVQPLFIGLSLSFVLTALGTTQTALFNRDMDFRALELRLMAGSVAGAAVGLVLAAGGYGAWALIAQQIATALASTVLLWALSPWHPTFTFSLASLRDLSSFSLNVFGTRIVFYLNRNGDNLLVGRFLGPAALGAYTVAYNLMLAPIGRIATPLVEVLFPAFSRMQDDRARIGELWLRAVRVVATITAPGMVGLALVAPEFVRVTLGDRWDAAIPVIQILAVVGLVQSLQGMNSGILQACDRTALLLRCALVTLVASVIGFVAGVHWGIVGVAVGYTAASLIAEPYYAWMTMRTLGVGIRAYLANLAGVFAAALGMGAVVVLARPLLPDGFGDLARLLTLALIGCLAYLPLWAWRAPEILHDLRGVLRRRRAPGPALAYPAPHS